MLTIRKDEIKGITSFTTYESGEIKECRLNNYNLISTKYGDFVPQYKDPGIRKKELKSLSFYKSGAIRSISLEEQTNIITSIGTFPAELVTFFEDGSINSLFPLNGQIGFSWSEEEEGQLSQKFDFEFLFGKFSAKIIGLRFYKNGKVRSLILWPDEIITINTPIGEIPIRIGFKLFEDGTLESFEPAEPISVKTPIGSINAFDINALAVDADENSLRFDRNGRLTSLVTSGDIIIIRKNNGKIKTISQKLRIGLMEDDFMKMPIKLLFSESIVIIDDGIDVDEYDTKECTFRILSDNSLRVKACSGECSGCSCKA
ncbi:MAG: membrane-binding protein [Ruminiclostridium sp.]